MLAVILTSGLAFAESGKEASSITFLPTVNSYDIDEVQVKDDDGDHWLDIGQRGKEGGQRSFFTGGDRCLVKYEDETSQIFWFKEAEGAEKIKVRGLKKGKTTLKIKVNGKVLRLKVTVI